MTKLRQRTKEALYNATLPSERKVSSLESNLLLSKRMKTTFPQSQKGTLNKDKLNENIGKMQSNTINELNSNMENILALFEKMNLGEMFFFAGEKEEEITQNKIYQKKNDEELDLAFKETINYAVLPETEQKFETTNENINSEEMFISLHVENMD